MSGLAGLLAGHHPPGVYQWHAAFGPDHVPVSTRDMDLHHFARAPEHEASAA